MTPNVKPGDQPASIFYLIYTSKSSHLMDNSDLSSLLAQSRDNNSRCGMTGMLVYMEGCFLDKLEGRFLQLLEGHQHDVRTIYERILTDKRNKSIILLDSGYIEDRVFPDWLMGFYSADKNALNPAGYFNLDDDFLKNEMFQKPSQLINYFKTFYEINKG